MTSALEVVTQHLKNFAQLSDRDIQYPNIVERIQAYHIACYLGITNPSLSRIRKRIENSKV